MVARSRSRARAARDAIWRVDIGAEPVQLTSDPRFEETFPQWSPDGNTIAFTRQPAHSPNARTLWLMESDGANPRQILEGNNSTLASRWFGLHVPEPQESALPLPAPNRPGPAEPTQSDVVTMPAPSPDGQWIVYQASGKDAGNVDIQRSLSEAVSPA